MRKILFGVITLFACSMAYSQAINMNLAKSCAEQWLASAGQKSLTDLDCVYTQSNEEKSQNYFYVFSSKSDNTFIIVSADERILPVLAYSDETFFDPNNIPFNMKGWLEGYVDEMNYVFTLVEAQKHPDWDNIFEGNITRGDRAVAPLINLLWDQDNPYNYYAPPTGNGPGGRCYAGCVATAMSMIMKFWNHPLHGFGSHTYTFSPYGAFTANFEEEYYQWDQMPIQATYNNYDAIAKLMYHCGISVDMQWGGNPNGSGAYTTDVPKALKTYFGYQTQCHHKNKSSDIGAWENMMRAELDLGRPMEYHGNSPASGGHAFVLDGYNDSNLFHFNWGWSGSGNGYFNISNLNPWGYNFNNNQGAVMNIEPRWDLFCNEPVNLNGSIDGTIVTLTWDEPASSNLTLTGYEVYKNGTNVATVTTTSYEELKVGFGEYEYCITACYDGGCKTSETAVCTTINSTICFPPIELQAFLDRTNVILFWAKPEISTGVSKYEIYRNEKYIAETDALDYYDEDLPYGDYRYCVIAIYGTNYQSDEACIDVEIKDPATNITNIDSDNVKIYPNPAKNNINITAPNITEVSIINSAGTIMKTVQTSCSELTLDLENFAKGVYVLKINTEGNVPVYKKFMISD